MIGKTVLVTGTTSGIGARVADELAAAGARLLVHGRDPERTAARAREVGGMPLVADFSRLAEVRAMAEQVRGLTDRLDVLVNNAGLMRDRCILTEDGYETTFQVNHLAPFLLTTLLLDRLRAAAPARIVNVASRMHERVKRFDLEDLARPSRFDGLEAYNRSKACNVLLTTELARRLAGSGVVANALHPGFVASRFGRDGDLGFGYELFFRLLRPVMNSVEQGADTVIWLASAPEAGAVSGRYVEKRRERPPARFAAEPDTARALWVLSERLVAATRGS